MKICEKRCAACLFGEHSLLDAPGVREAKIQECAEADSYFVCHEATARGEDVMCRGWWDELRWATNPGRIAERLGIEPSWRPEGKPTDEDYAATIAFAKKELAARRRSLEEAEA